MMPNRQQELFPPDPSIPYCWTIMEIYNEKIFTTEEMLAEIEQYTGKLDPQIELTPIQAFHVPGSNFFIMDVTNETTAAQ